jgi:dTDP-glucose 4,6-dehydratase
MNIVGERQDPEKFFPKIIAKTLQGSPIEVHAKFENDQWHAGSRCYLHARNQADALKFIIERFSQNSSRFSQGLVRPHRFHVVGEKELKNDELVRIIQSVIGKTSLIKYVDFHGARPGHDLRYALEPGSLKELGWSPPVPLEKSIEKSIDWYLKNPKWLQTNLI